MVLPPILYQLVPSVIRLTEDPSVSASDVVAVDAASLAMVLVTDGVMTMLLVTDGVMAMELVTSVVTPIVPSTVVTASVVVCGWRPPRRRVHGGRGGRVRERATGRDGVRDHAGRVAVFVITPVEVAALVIVSPVA